MTAGNRVVDPSDLDCIAIAISNLDLAPNRDEETTTDLERYAEPTTLALLHPLAREEMFATCRNPESMFIRDGAGNKIRPSDHEILDLGSLSLAWRRQLLKVPPFTRLVFDLRMPKKDEMSNTVPKISWDSTMGADPGIFVETQQVINIAITIATETRMRAKGDLEFTLVYDEKEGVRQRTMEGLRKQLNNVANYKPQAQNSKEDARKDCRICNPPKS